jgi:hypothetical protein
MDDMMLQLLKQAADNPQYKLLTDYLTARRALPEMKTSYLTPGTEGVFRSNPGRTNGELVLNSADGGPDINTLLHELTHAAEHQLGNQYSETAKYSGLFSSKGSSQFTQAYDKLRLGHRLDEIPPDFLKSNEGYRASYAELPAFGMGSTASANNFSAPQHVDPTQATEMVTLLTLALKDLNSKPQSQGR